MYDDANFRSTNSRSIWVLIGAGHLRRNIKHECEK